MLKDAKDAAALDRRKAARRWLPFVAGFALGQVTERCLRQIVHLRAMERVPLSRDTWVRDCGLLRRWIRRGQLARHRRALLAPRWRTIPGGERRRPAAAALIPIQVQRLLRGARCPRLRVMIALAYGCQLLPREFEALRFEDLAMDYAHVVVATASRRGRAGVTCRKRVWLPAWVRDLARGAWGEMPRASGWCFAHARRPGEHRRNSDGLLWGGSGLLTGMALEQHLRSRRVPGGPTEGERLGAVAAGLVRGLAVEISRRCGLGTTC